MNWYKIHKTFCRHASLTKVAGEYWIDERGNPESADGDAGDMNHESHVIDHLLYEYGFSPEEIDLSDPSHFESYIESHLGQITEYLKTKNKWAKTPQEEQMLEEDPDAALQKAIYLITSTELYQLAGATPEEAKIMSNNFKRDEARLYAKKQWGWKRVEGRNIETWTFTPKDIQMIYHGMGEILDANGFLSESGKDPLININVESTKAWYEKVPLSVLGSNNILKIEQYNSMRNKDITRFTPKRKTRPQMPSNRYEGG